MGFSDGIGFQVKVIHDGLSRRLKHRHEEHWVTVPQFAVLSYLAEHENERVLVKDIMTYMQIDQSTASILIKRMEKNGLIVCQENHEDRRQKIIVMNRGKALPLIEYERAESGVIEEKLLNGLNQQERAELNRMMQIVVNNVVHL